MTYTDTDREFARALARYLKIEDQIHKISPSTRVMALRERQAKIKWPTQDWESGRRITVDEFKWVQQFARRANYRWDIADVIERVTGERLYDPKDFLGRTAKEQAAAGTHPKE